MDLSAQNMPAAVKTWRERIGVDADFPLHLPTDVERAMVGEIKELRAQLARQAYPAEGAAQHANDFARIVRATSGQQVLFFKEVDLDDGNLLHCVASFDGYQVDIKLGGTPDTDFAMVLDKVDTEMADIVLAQIVELGLNEVSNG